MRAPWQSSVTLEAVMRTPRSQTQDGSRCESTVISTRSPAWLQSISCDPGASGRRGRSQRGQRGEGSQYRMLRRY
jgi:hypothetical protein